MLLWQKKLVSSCQFAISNPFEINNPKSTIKLFLNCHTYYSLRYGTLSVDSLIAEAKNLSLSALALTDINTSMGIPDFVRECNENGIKPIAGIEFRNNENQLLYTAIARNNDGFREINEFLTGHNLNKTPLPDSAPELNHAYLIYPFDNTKNTPLNENEFIGIKPSQVRRLISSHFRHNQSKLIIFQPLTFKNQEEYDLHRHLRAIDNNLLLSQLPPSQIASPDERFMTLSKLISFFDSYPEIVRNSMKITEECNISFDFHSHKNKSTFTGNRYDDKILLEKLAKDGLNYRYGKNNKVALQRLLHELEIIDKLGFSAYFLITWDVIRYSMSRGFYHVGRGSGANSIVAYCLKITDVDPIELDLYFERFLNPKRSSPPDFDIDYSWKDRDEVIDYIFKRYGRQHTALLGATTTFQGRSILRELGKVHGLPKAEIDELVAHPERAATRDHISQKILQTGRMMKDFPNIRSIHAGGILISEEPITCYTALDMPPKGFPTTQWDMYVAESIGFEKLDILSQRGIGHINESVEIILKNKGVKVDVHQVEKFKKNQQVKYQLKTAETTGCFYIESPAMRGLLRKLKCDDYLTLVAASSIIRPGVARSGMMREYIYRFHHPGKFTYIHPVMEQQLKETYGVMVYQEDVLKVCHHFAGLDLADSDVLRRAMSGKFRGKKEFQRIVDKFFSNCKEKGYTDEVTAEVWRQIESFAGYSFSKAHSASFAVESFQSLWLKAHYPLEFMVAVINNFGGFYQTWVYVNEAKRQGATIELPCVNHSDYKTNIYNDHIYLGFIHIANLEKTVAKAIVPDREENGEFRNLQDFTERISITNEQLSILIRIGAFRFTGKGKAELLWEAYLFSGKKEPALQQSKLFHLEAKTYQLPKLEHNLLEDVYDEIELLGFPVSLSYFDLLKTKYRSPIHSNNLIDYVGKRVKTIGHLATIKFVRTIKGEMMHFGTFIDQFGEVFDTTHFPDSLRKYPYRGSGMYLLEGIVVEEFGYPTINIEKQAKLPLESDPRESDK